MNRLYKIQNFIDLFNKSGKDPSRQTSVADKVVLELINSYLDESRILCTDNFYSSVWLAEKLIPWKTDLIGTLRKNRKDISKENWVVL